MTKIAMIGGGVIGLSIAYEMSKRNHEVILLEKDQVGRKASWAGAGIITPANLSTAIHPLEKLEAISSDLHRVWSSELKTQTGIDNGYTQSGGLYVARSAGELASLAGAIQHWEERQIEFEIVDASRYSDLVPGNPIAAKAKSVFVPSETQIRNPHHLQALLNACIDNGVQIVEGGQEIELVVEGQQTIYARVGSQRIAAEKFCLVCGPWTEQLATPFQVSLPTTPVRGQMVLFKLPARLFAPIINEGSRYLVPRSDGHVLAGSTIDEVGFNTNIELADVEELKRWANSLVAECNEQSFVKAWAGLRPGTYDGFPYLGWIGRSHNTLVATGHFKSGLQLSTGTAVVIADLLEDKTPPIDLTPFSPARAEFHQSTETT